MLIVCPTCESRYDITAEAVPRGGRAVRCSRCRTEWRVFPEPGGEMSAAAFGLDDPGEEGATPDGATDTPDIAIDAATLEEGGFDIDARVVEPIVPRPAARRPLRKAKPKQRGKPVGWAKLALAAGLVALVALFAGRSVVVRVFPQTASLYALFGLTVNLRGLEFAEVRTSMLTEGGVPVLVVEGLVQSLLPKPANLPRLRVSLTDEKGAEIYNWTAVIAREALPPGQALPFKTRLASPPPEARSVVVRFLSRQDMVAAVR